MGIKIRKQQTGQNSAKLSQDNPVDESTLKANTENETVESLKQEGSLMARASGISENNCGKWINPSPSAILWNST